LIKLQRQSSMSSLYVPLCFCKCRGLSIKIKLFIHVLKIENFLVNLYIFAGLPAVSITLVYFLLKLFKMP
jgi:hypothetical protein